MNTNYYIPFAFVLKETFEFYKWLFECIKELNEYFDISDFNIIFTDAQKSLIKAISTVYPLASNLLFRWQINKNVPVNCQKWFDNEAWRIILDVWHKVLYKSTEEVFHEIRHK